MSQFHLETEIIRSQIERSQHQEHSSPLYLTSSYVFEDAEEMRASFSEEKEPGFILTDPAFAIKPLIFFHFFLAILFILLRTEVFLMSPLT